MLGSKEKNNDWNKGAWIINTMVEWRWWRRVGLIELQEDCQYQEIIQFFSFKKQAGLSVSLRLCRWDRFVWSFSCVILCLFLKENVKHDKFHCLPFFFNPWITEGKNFLYLWNWTHIVHIFLKWFSQVFFQGSLNRLNCSQKFAFIQISHFFMELCRVKYLKCLRTRKYILEHKCERDLSLVWLCLVTDAFYLYFLDSVVLAHPFWALATFPVCFSALSCWTNRAPSTGTKWSSWT